MHGFRWAAVALAVAALALAAAACGGGDDSGSATTEAATTEAAATEPATEETTEEVAGTLTGTVGPGFTITMNKKTVTQDGAPVESLPAGTYEFVIDDESDAHNFHLTGANVDETKDVGETGQVTWVLTLEAGEFTYVCDPHASQMNGSFTVT